MKKQFIIYDFDSNTFFVSINQDGIIWGKPPMLFPSRDEAEKCIENAYNLFPYDFDNRIIVITDVLISDNTFNLIKI
jgi:hypothetical protein